VFKAHRLCVSLNSSLESNKEEEDPGALLLPPALESTRNIFIKVQGQNLASVSGTDV